MFLFFGLRLFESKDMNNPNEKLQLEWEQLEIELNRVELLKKIKALRSKLRPMGKVWDGDLGIYEDTTPDDSY